MAVIAPVSCPNCDKKFKPKADVQGKKIKCPFCTKPFVVPAGKDGKDGKKMADEHAVICLHCGYNTLTRQRGKTDKLFGLTIDRHLKYLLPPMGALVFSIFAIAAMIWHDVLTPYYVEGGFLSILDSEAGRFW